MWIQRVIVNEYILYDSLQKFDDLLFICSMLNDSTNN